MELLVKKHNIIWDATTFSTFQNCARKSDFRHNLHLVKKDGKGRSLEMGSIVHKGLEVYGQNLISGQKRAVAVSCGITAAIEYSQNSAEVRNTAEQEKQLALDTLEEYFEHYKNDAWTLLEVESTHGVKLYEDDDMRIIWKAKLDTLVDTNELITSMDHKTMSQRRDDTTLNNQFIGQCVVLGVRRMFINKIGFQVSLKPHERFQRVPMYFSPARIMEWTGEIVPFWTRLYLAYKETGYWAPNFTGCETKWGKCEYNEICQADIENRENELKRLFEVGEPWDIGND